MDEFDFISLTLEPLTNGNETARGLRDDVAFIHQHNLIVTKDVLQAGIHFNATDALCDVAKKALRVNLSDIYSKGGRPFGYLLGLILPADMTAQDVLPLIDGFREDQARFELFLMGGDTVRGQGPLTLSITMFGYGPDSPPTRSGAQPGDLLYVTGTIGDSWLGLTYAEEKLKEQVDFLSLDQIDYIRRRYLLPEPREAFATGGLYELVTASIDISDGLIADAGHIARHSQLGIEIDLKVLPLSGATRLYITHMADSLSRRRAMISLITGGDDYEILCTVAPGNATAFEAKATSAGLEVTCIGKCTEDIDDVAAFYKGEKLKCDIGGYRHL